MRCPTLYDLPPPPPGKRGWPWTEASVELPDPMPDGQEWPRVSIVTPSYQQGPFIEETIRSVLLQGYPNLEYIVIDGGSTDETVAILRKYEKWIAYWVSEADKGQSEAINKGFAKASGDLFGWLNSDDVYERCAIPIIAKYFTQDGGRMEMAGTWTSKARRPGLATGSSRTIAGFFPQRILSFSRLHFGAGKSGRGPEGWIRTSIGRWTGSGCFGQQH